MKETKKEFWLYLFFGVLSFILNFSTYYFLIHYTFMISRLGTLFLEEILLYLFISVFSVNADLTKFTGQVIVIAVNYILSKNYIFIKGELK